MEDGCGNKVIVYCPFTVADPGRADGDLRRQPERVDRRGGLCAHLCRDVDEGSNDNCNEVSLAVRRSGVVLGQFGRVIPFICGSQVSP